MKLKTKYEKEKKILQQKKQLLHILQDRLIQLKYFMRWAL